jgi:hypothetical protein
VPIRRRTSRSGESSAVSATYQDRRTTRRGEPDAASGGTSRGCKRPRIALRSRFEAFAGLLVKFALRAARSRRLHFRERWRTQP